MLTDSKIRQVGFIRNSSSRRIVYRPELQQKKQVSDDSFSSFEFENNHSQNIHKPQPLQKPSTTFQTPSLTHQKPPIPKPPKSLHQSIPFQNTKLKNNFIKQTNNQQNSFRQERNQNTTKFGERSNFNSEFQNDLIEVRNICKGISNIGINFTNKHVHQRVEEDFLPKQSKFQSFQQGKARKFQYDIDSQSEESQNRNNYQQNNQNHYNNYNKYDRQISYQTSQKKRPTLSNNPKNTSLNPKPQHLKNPHFHTYQNDQQLVTQYQKTQFNPHPSITNRSNNYQSYHPQVNQSNVYAKQGGISFQVDVKQFSQPVVHTIKPRRRQESGGKRKKVNTKEDLLKRREMAKIYSKQSRFRLFGFS